MKEGIIGSILFAKEIRILHFHRHSPISGGGPIFFVQKDD